MRMMGAFLRERKREVWLGVVLIGTFACVSYLYRVRMDAVTYALMLSAVFCLLFGVPDFLRFVRKHRELVEVESGFLSGFAKIPECETLLEEDYQRILSKFYEALLETDSAGRIARQEMVDYYGMWAHQIKTPIAAMHVLLQALEGGEFEEGCGFEEDGEDVDGSLTSVQGCEFEDGGGPLVSVRGFTKEMKLELFKIEQYVEMALTYLRMEDMSSDLSFEVFSLDSIIRQAVRKYSQMFILKRIGLVYVPVELKVLTDEKWLVFVLEQLLSNALKYTLSGKISIYLEDTTCQTCLVIEDTGIGICSEDLPRVFEKGFTGYNGRTDKKSTGIGLYLCKSVMDRLRHRIWMESEVGAGTKVFLSLGRENVRHE